ncbi:Alpha/Beta hydrolase protein [Trichoderma velutinum]
MTSPKRYTELPTSANKEAIKAFTLAVPDAELTRMKTLLQLSTVASATYENTYAEKSKELGLNREWLVAAKDRWENIFDWRKREQLVNSFANFKAAIPVSTDESTSIDIHFTALFSSKPDAIPVVFLHGWPGSFFEFLPMLKLLREKYPEESTLPYHVIVPSLPGYGLSDPPPSERDFAVEDASRMIDHLMSKVLGFKSYVSQGGDVGAGVARTLGARHENCRAVHLNFTFASPPPNFDMDGLDERDIDGLRRGGQFSTSGMAYALMQATRPATVGFILMSNPLAILIWLGEKFLEWTDPASFPHSPKSKDPVSSEEKYPYSLELMDEVIAAVSLYYLTGCANTCLYPYRDYMPGGQIMAANAYTSAEFHVSSPKVLGYSSFPKELFVSPQKLIATSGNLVFFNRHDKGGHFAAMEQPALLLEDVETFVKKFATKT